ncbi:MAG: sulfite exporter TauE/SafE family protein [Vicinamibacterales bacterium]
MPASDLWPLLGLFAVGLVAGGLNVVAGGGSFLTLPLLIFLGLPAAEANATNRVGLLAQNLAGVWAFHRSRAVNWRWGLAVSLPTVIGAVLGARWALQFSDVAFRRVLSIVMLLMTPWMLARARPPAARAGLWSPWHPAMVAAFFAIGVYGGLIQVGNGFAILAATSLAGMDLVQGNAIKVLAVLALAAVSLAVFAHGGAVHWGEGAALGLGNVIGALGGVRLALTRGHAWIQRVVIVVVVVFAVLLWLER